MKTTSSYITDIPRILNNSDSDNAAWGLEMVNDAIRYLVSKYYFNERSYTVPNGTVPGTQFYNLPPQVKKLIDVTILVGNVLWRPKECPTRQFWDDLNVVQFNQDYPSYFFVYNNQVGIYPKPSSSGNTFTMNYKTRITDLSLTDVTCSANIAITTNTTTVTATGATFASWMAGQWIRVAPVQSGISGANGDGQWYQIDTVTSSTVLVLKNPYAGATVAAATATIGEVPILPEDYQDLPLYRLGIVYYTTRFPDPVRAAQYQALWDDGEKRLNEEFGSKTTDVVLQDTDSQMINTNLYQRNLS